MKTFGKRVPSLILVLAVFLSALPGTGDRSNLALRAAAFAADLFVLTEVFKKRKQKR